MARLRINGIEQVSERIGEPRLFDQADHDEGHADSELPLPAWRIGLPSELVHDLRPACQWSGNRLRKERDIERVAPKRIVRRPSASQIHQIHDVVKSKERDAERQRYVEMPERSLEP